MCSGPQITKRAITECQIHPSVWDNVLCINMCLVFTDDSLGAAELLSVSEYSTHISLIITVCSSLVEPNTIHVSHCTC